MGLDTDRGWSRIRRVPGSIPGATESDFRSYVLKIFEEFGVCLGRIFGHFSEMFGTCFRTYFGHVWDIVSEIFQISYGISSRNPALLSARAGN